MKKIICGLLILCSLIYAGGDNTAELRLVYEVQESVGVRFVREGKAGTGQGNELNEIVLLSGEVKKADLEIEFSGDRDSIKIDYTGSGNFNVDSGENGFNGSLPLFLVGDAQKVITATMEGEEVEEVRNKDDFYQQKLSFQVDEESTEGATSGVYASIIEATVTIQ
ncbi:hypothetical protein PM10SUCC1_08590 [Propionigenium maris DSM 9537]|uniref:Uncharacterized protein n=1 Tax=Propionigenium maris DSM 9537 TaxID=1123000 RepID=A0A9W6GJK8_9FUSO|nr:hypothetical protein [Propionigenium maris]GLI55345.1 hypothetical protein PM10SUCC1_08590 [Propionigenium maris DSM 9537]